jgi:hypothetical protein
MDRSRGGSCKPVQHFCLEVPIKDRCTRIHLIEGVCSNPGSMREQKWRSGQHISHGQAIPEPKNLRTPNPDTVPFTSPSTELLLFVMYSLPQLASLGKVRTAPPSRNLLSSPDNSLRVRHCLPLSLASMNAFTEAPVSLVMLCHGATPPSLPYTATTSPLNIEIAMGLCDASPDGSQEQHHATLAILAGCQ